MNKENYEIMLSAHKRCRCVASDFVSDVRIFTSVDMLISRHYEAGSTNYRLLVNYVLICYNSFGAEHASYGFDVVLKESNKNALTSILIYTQRVPITAPHDQSLLEILETL
jgi:hypothetical protein